MSQIQQVKDAHNIVDVIGGRVALQRAGSNYKGLCPFHSEKSPSFFVSEEMQRYKCFGCGVSGDIYTFLEQYEGMTFQEALESLAAQAGIKLEKLVPNQQDELRRELLVILDLAREYYHWLLVTHAAGEPARKYLRERGIAKDSIKLFQLGFALPQWDGLLKFLHGKKKFSKDALVQAGLALKSSSGRVYDRFRARIMFPLRNHRGQVVGFSGRILPELADAKDEGAKYINSPETLLYHKSEMLYGYSELRQSIRKAERALVVEGEFDVISSVQAHVGNIVAIKGSALTTQHVRLLSRTADSIVLCLDADKAGIAATQKAIEVVASAELSREKPLDLRVVRIPKGKDPDDFARSDPKGWRELTKHSISVYDFLIEVAFEQFDATSPSGKREIMQFLSPWLSKVGHAVELEHYVKTLSTRLGVKETSIEKDLSKVGLRLPSRRVPAKRELVGKDADEREKPTRRQQLEKRVWFLLLHSAAAFEQRRAELAKSTLSLSGSQQLLDRLSAHPQQDWQAVSKSLPEDQQELLFELYSEESVLDAEYEVSVGEWKRTLSDLMQEIRREKTQLIASELEKLEQKNVLSSAELARQEELLRELVMLQRKTEI